MPQDGPQPPDAPSDGDLAHALSRAGAAIAEDAPALAARWADRARRLAPKSPKVAELQGRLALLEGDYPAAVGHLEAAAADGASPAVDAMIVEAQLRMSDVDAAMRRIALALNRFAVHPHSPLVPAARACAEAAGAPGWMGLGLDLDVVGEARGGGALELVLGGRRLAVVTGPAAWPSEEGRAFRARCAALDGGQVDASLDGVFLVGAGLATPPDLRLDGRVLLTGGRLAGWVRVGWAPDQIPALSFRIGAGGPRRRIETTPLPSGDGRFGFDVDIGGEAADAEATIEVDAPGGARLELPGSPARARPPPAPQGLGRRRLGARPVAAAPCAVIIPVYRGEAQTLACISSVRATTGPETRIVVVDDASPEPDLSAALRALADRGLITLLRNEANLGFAASVNRALELPGAGDVVLLNADAEVYAGWLESLRRTAHAAPKAGTVTPLSNAGAIASYPKGLYSPCDADEAADRHRLAGQVNAGIAVEAPTGVGFCLYIRRECLAETGPLDAACFGRGYGEETDFCLRASALGWRHYIAADVYVRHHDGVSFGPDRDALVTRNEVLLAARHPDYARRLDLFARRDPLAAARRRLDEARLRRPAGPVALLVTHALGGGVERRLGERRRELREMGMRALTLTATDGRLRIAPDGEDLNDLVYETAQERDAVLELLFSLNPRSVEVHHMAGHDGDLVLRLMRGDRESLVFVHDYSWFCPRITLVDGSGVYCGEPDEAVCEVCVARNGSEMGPISVSDLRARSLTLMSAARRVAAPSADAAARIARRYPGLTPLVRPLERRVFLPTRRSTPGGAVKVAVIGAIGDAKGYQVIAAAAKDALQRALPLSFVVIGFTSDDAALLSLGNVFITGRYLEDEVAGLIRREAPDVALFGSVWPETWLYALTHALKARLPILAFDLGAQAERIRAARGVCTLLPLTSPPSAVNDALLELARRPAPSALQDLRDPRGAQEPPATASRNAPDASGPFSRPSLYARGDEDGRVPTPWPQTSFAPQLISNDPRDRRAPPNPSDVPDMPKAPLGLAASAQVLTLAKGIYRFSVNAGGADRYRPETGINLPALQISAAPNSLAGSVEFMTGLKTDGAWLFDTGDVLIAKVKGESTPLLITSYNAEGLAPLAISVERIDEPATDVRAPGLAPPRPRAALPGAGADQSRLVRPSALTPPRLTSGGRGGILEEPRRALRFRVTAHISRRGDVDFLDEEWIGGTGLKQAIEGVTIMPLDGLDPRDIEYKAVSEKGIETPWTPGGEFCGTRRLGLALSGFALRTRGEAARRIECRYNGAFKSGAVIGPASNGAPVRSNSLDDVLTGLKLSFHLLEADAREAPPAPLMGRGPDRPGPARALGPRFSVFREESSPTEQ